MPALTDRSGTITTGGTDQLISAATPTRQGYQFQNNSTGDLWINDMGGTASASQPNLKIIAGGYYESPKASPCPYGIRVWGATTAQPYTCREW